MLKGIDSSFPLLKTLSSLGFWTPHSPEFSPSLVSIPSASFSSSFWPLNIYMPQGPVLGLLLISWHLFSLESFIQPCDFYILFFFKWSLYQWLINLYFCLWSPTAWCLRGIFIWIARRHIRSNKFKTSFSPPYQICSPFNHLHLSKCTIVYPIAK